MSVGRSSGLEAPIFYASPDGFSEDIIELDKSESHHASKVMRLRQGDFVMLVDGLGQACRGEIERIGRGRLVCVKVHTRIRNYGEPFVKLTLAAGLSVGSKLDTIVQKATELGVSRFVPILSERSKVKLDDPRRAANKIKRLNKIALAAIKQCRRSCCPVIAGPVSFETFVKETDPESVNLLFHPKASKTTLADCLSGDKVSRITVLVGPESGFSDDEAEAAIAAGYKSISLGQRILRSETAAPAVCAIVMDRLGELS